MVRLNNQATVPITAKKIVPYNGARTSLVVYNADPANTIYYGSDKTVTTSNGIPIQPQTKEYFNVGLGDRPDWALWLIAATAPCDVRWGEATRREE